MKTLHHCMAGYLGYYANLEALLSRYPEGGEAGSFFLNGETSTLWMWSPVTLQWCDSNYTAAPALVGMISDPATFAPPITAGQEALYYYVAVTPGTYGFPKLPGTQVKVEVECTQSGIILLHWDGSKWQAHAYSLSLSPITRHTYRGAWNAAATYTRNNDYIDVVCHNGVYYRPVLYGTVKNVAPGNTAAWEQVAGFAALANGLQIMEQDGNGMLTISDDMCSLTVTSAAGKELANLQIVNDSSGTFVQLMFTYTADGIVYTTTISPTGIYISEGEAGSVGTVISKRCVINAEGISDSAI